MTPFLQAKQEIENALFNAALQGAVPLRDTLFTKIASLVKTPEQIEAVINALMQTKTAEEGRPRNGVLHGLLKAGMFAAAATPPILAGVKYFKDKQKSELSQQAFREHAADLYRKDPQRTEALFQLLQKTAPEIADNTVVAKDLVAQMAAVPSMDIGTVKALTDIKKNYGDSAGKGPKGVPAMIEGGGKALEKLSSARVLPAHGMENGKPTFFNWHTEEMKKAGIEGLFNTPNMQAGIGNGDAAQRKDNMDIMQADQMGMSMLPLDAVLYELMQKEQELLTRESVIAQQEQQLQQAMGMYQGVQQGFQNQYGVDPNQYNNPQGAMGGDPNAMGGDQGGMGGDQGGMGGDPNAMGGDPNADPNAMGGDPNADPNAMGAGDPNADPNAMGAGDPAAMGGDPAAMGGDPTASDPAAMGADPNAMGGDPTASDPAALAQAALDQTTPDQFTEPDAAQLTSSAGDEAAMPPGVAAGGGDALPPPAAPGVGQLSAGGSMPQEITVPITLPNIQLSIKVSSALKPLAEALELAYSMRGA